MKQHITKEQLDELSFKQRVEFVENCYHYHEIIASSPEVIEFQIEELIKDRGLPTIGQMIEFLGDDLVNINRKDNGEFVAITTKLSPQCYGGDLGFCDALFEAVKNKPY